MDKDKTLVSIIVPVYNAELYLEECINSILEQTYKNLEIILLMMVLPIILLRL